MALTKTTFRKKCLDKIKNSAKHNRFYKNQKINFWLFEELKKIKKREILFYTSLPFEADTAKAIKKMRKKYRIFVPFMQGESFKMVPFRLPLKKKKFYQKLQMLLDNFPWTPFKRQIQVIPDFL
jgi:5-formyltetrahydrofolate cyclo-ligase